MTSGHSDCDITMLLGISDRHDPLLMKLDICLILKTGAIATIFFFKEIFLSNRFQSPISTRSQRREIAKDSAAYIFQKSLSLNYAEMCSLNAVGEEKG